MRARVRLVRLLLLVLLAASLVASDAQATEESAQRGTAEGSSNWTREPLRIALEKLLAWNLGADVSIGAIAGPLVPELTLRDVTIDVRGSAWRRWSSSARRSMPGLSSARTRR